MKLHSELPTPESFAWQDARDEARTQLRRFTRRVTAQVYLELDALFIEARANDEQVLSVEDIDVASVIARVAAERPELVTSNAG